MFSTATLQDIAKTPDTLDIKFIDDKLKEIKSLPVDNLKETIYEKMIEWSILLDRNKGIEENRRERLQMITGNATQMQALQIAPILHVVRDPTQITTIELTWDRTISKQLEDDNPGKLLDIHLQFLRDVGFNVLPQMIPFLCLNREGPQEIWSLCVDNNFIVINGVPISTPVSMWERFDESCSFLYASGERLTGLFYNSLERIDLVVCPRWIDLLCSQKHKNLKDLSFRAVSDKDSDWIGNHNLFCDEHGLHNLVYFETLTSKKEGTKLRDTIAIAPSELAQQKTIFEFWKGILSRIHPSAFSNVQPNITAPTFFQNMNSSFAAYIKTRYNENDELKGESLDKVFTTLKIPTHNDNTKKIIRIYVLRLIAWIFEAPYLKVAFPRRYGKSFKNIAELKLGGKDTGLPYVIIEPGNDTLPNEIRIQAKNATEMNGITKEFPEILLQLYGNRKIQCEQFWDFFLNVNINPTVGGIPIFILEKGKYYRSLFLGS